jgi:hypothetical protein
MTTHTLKIGPLPDRTPVKLSLLIDPALKAELDAYAEAYANAYGERASVEALVPVMLETFLGSDAGFRRSRQGRRG